MTDTFDAYRQRHPGSPFTKWLIHRYEEAWRNATQHRFTAALADDSLEDDVFRRYLIQDFAFIQGLAGLVGFAVGRAPDYPARCRLAGFLSVLTGNETSYFERAMDALGIDPALREEPPAGRVAQRLLDLMHDVAEKSYADILSVLAAAEWCYQAWASEAANKRRPKRFYLAEWIDLHADEGFREFVDWLRAQLDRHGAAHTIARQEQIARQFCRTLELEVEFFDAAYEDETPGDA